jgi:hypothetical protein
MIVLARMERTRNWLRRPLAKTPYVYDALMSARHDRRDQQTQPDTAITIEGYPRCGNTYSVAAFRTSNSGERRVASHLHAPAHVKRAVRMGVPLIVLIREPAGAVLSQVIRRPKLTIRDALLDYISFYEATWPLRDEYVVGNFPLVTSDFGAVIDAVNERFKTCFNRYEHTPENEAATFALVEELNRKESFGALVETKVARPSPVREQLKKELATELEESEILPVLRHAQAIYDSFIACDSAVRGP